MISPTQAATILHKKYPRLVIKKCVELPDHWLFTAIEKNIDVDYNDPFYAIRKTDGLVCSYSPFDDIDNFNKAKVVTF